MNANESKVRMNGKKYFLFSLVILAIFLFSGLASAAPPSGVFPVQDSGTSIHIAYPKYEFISQNKGFDLHSHVINSTSQLTNLTTSCWIHLYDPAGKHILKENMSFANGGLFEFEFDIPSSNFSKLGDHAYIIQCFTYNEVGFASGVFTVTPSGSGIGDYPEFFYIILIIFYGVAFIGFFAKNEWVAMIGGMGMIALGIYIINNGIIIFRDVITDYIAWLTVGLGIFFSLYSGLSLIKENV